MWTIDCDQNIFICHAKELEERKGIMVIVISSAVKKETLATFSLLQQLFIRIVSLVYIMGHILAI